MTRSLATFTRATAVGALLAAAPCAYLQAQTYGVVVTPQGTTTANRTTHHSGYTQVFRVQNEGTAQQTFTLTCLGASNVTCTNVSPAGPIVLNGNTFQNITATYSVGNEGTGQLYFTASGPQSTDQGWVNVPVVLPAGAPKMSVLPYLEAKQDYGRCAASCFAAAYAQSTVPYVSLDTPRNVTLVYHGDRVAPKPFVHVDVWPDSSFGGGWPSEYQLQVKINGALVTFLNGEQTLRFSEAGGTPNRKAYRIGGQFTPPALSHGAVRSMEILVSTKIAGLLYTNRWITQYLHLDEASSPTGRGWTLSGVQRAFIAADTGVLITEGDGSATYFKYNPITLKYDAPTGDFSTLAASGGNWIRAFPDSTKLTFNSGGRLVRVADRFANRDTLIYDGSNRVIRIKDPINDSLTFAYGANGLSSIRDHGGRFTNVTVDGSKRLTAIQDPDGVSTSFGYDGSLRLQTITDRRGKVTTLYYNTSSGKLDSTKSPSIPVYSVGTAAPVARFAPWQVKGVPYAATSGTPFVQPLVDSAYALVTEPGGGVNKLTVNRWGSPVRATAANGDLTTVAYTLAGLPARIIRPGYGGGDKDSLAYNASGLVTYSYPARSTATTIVYGGWAQPTSISGTGQETIQNYLGTNGRVDSARVGGTVVRRTTYDAKGRPTIIKDGKSVAMATYAYVGSGSHQNLSSGTSPGSRTTSHGYDSYGRRIWTKGPMARPDTTTFDAINRVTSTIQWAGAGSRLVTSTSYFTDSTVVTDPKNQKYSYLYNAVGWVIRETDPVARRDTFAYSIDGDLRRHTNRRAQTITYTYDAVHRPLTRVGTATVSWSYGTGGRVVTATSAQTTETVYANVLGLPDSVKTVFTTPSQTYWRRYNYSTYGLLDSTRVSGGGITSFKKRTYAYDATKGVLNSISLGTAVTTFNRDANFNDTSRTFPGGGNARITLGNLQAPLKLTSTAAYANGVERWIGVDTVGRVDKHLGYQGNAGRFFQYDSLSRLRVAKTMVDNDGTPPPAGCPDPDYALVGSCFDPLDWVVTGVPDTFAYDGAGNRTDRGGTYTTGNRITAFNGCTYTTDFDGNVTGRTCGATTTGFTWNAEGQLTDVTTTGQPAVKYYYDAFGRLVRKDAGGSAASYFLWDGDNLVAELGASANTKVAEYSYYPGLDRLHALVVDTAAYYAHQDGLVNTIQLSKGTTVFRKYDYTEWGLPKPGSGYDGLPFSGKDRARWKGALWVGPDSTLYYMRSRWYEAGTGRFLSEDPLGLAGGINTYSYASNDPVNKVDPLGLECYEVYYYAKWVYSDGRVEYEYIGRGWEGDCAQGASSPQNQDACGPLRNKAFRAKARDLFDRSMRSGFEEGAHLWASDRGGTLTFTYRRGDILLQDSVNVKLGPVRATSKYRGNIHTHPDRVDRVGANGLFGDSSLTMSGRYNFWKVVADPDSLFLIGTFADSARVLHACGY